MKSDKEKKIVDRKERKKEKKAKKKLKKEKKEKKKKGKDKVMILGTAQLAEVS